MWGVIASIAGSALGPLAGYMGQERANASNEAIANNATAFNAAEAEKNRQFQERMSSTAHQREVEDLKKAGLNPLLALNTGASSPSGSTASAATAHMENSLEGVAATAMEMARLKLANTKQEKEIELMDAQKKKTETEEKVISKGIPEAEIKNDAFDVIRPYLKKMKEKLQDSAKEGPPAVRGYDEKTKTFKYGSPYTKP